MNKLCCFIILFVGCGICEGQNLVPNGSFEDIIGCPHFPGDLDSCSFWITPSVGSSDYFNQCASGQYAGVPYNYLGYQNAHSGAAFSGIIIFSLGSNYREYIEAPLTSPLVAGACYHLEMYINLGGVSKYTDNDISAYFSDSLIVNFGYNPLPFTPQINNTAGNFPDTANWNLVSGNYMASGGEHYLIIGNFNGDANTDTMLIHPAETENWAYIFIDDVSLTLCTGIDEQNQNNMIDIFPNPIKDKLNVTINDIELSEIIIYDIASGKLLQEKFTGTVTLNTAHFAEGIYIYEVRNKNGVIKKGKVVKE